MPKKNPKNTPGSRQSKKKSGAQRKKKNQAPRALEHMRNLTTTYNAIKKEEAELAKQGKTISKEKQDFIDYIDREAPKACEAAIKIRKEETKGRGGKFGWFWKKKKD